jgi:hypothetical protein
VKASEGVLSLAFSVHDCGTSFTRGQATFDLRSLSFKHLLRCAVLCNSSQFSEESKFKESADGRGKEEEEITTRQCDNPGRRGA